jgi:hypothetical protein
MLADEELSISENPDLTDAKDIIIDLVKWCIEKAIIPFKKVREKQYNNAPLNENALTQIFVHQVEPQIKKRGCNFLAVDKQYYDTVFNTKGVSDFYFHKSEEGIDHEALFVVEVKRLPAPDHKRQREKEYVIGGNNNGGIERYKTEKHGKWLSKSGMIGFVEEGSFQNWLDRINGWIVDLSAIDKDWADDEILVLEHSNADYCFLSSIAHRNHENSNLELSHWWIDICDSH